MQVNKAINLDHNTCYSFRWVIYILNLSTETTASELLNMILGCNLIKYIYLEETLYIK